MKSQDNSPRVPQLRRTYVTVVATNDNDNTTDIEEAPQEPASPASSTNTEIAPWHDDEYLPSQNASSTFVGSEVSTLGSTVTDVSQHST